MSISHEHYITFLLDNKIYISNKYQNDFCTELNTVTRL